MFKDCIIVFKNGKIGLSDYPRKLIAVIENYEKIKKDLLTNTVIFGNAFSFSDYDNNRKNTNNHEFDIIEIYDHLNNLIWRNHK